MQKTKQFKVYENQLTLLIDTDSKKEAINVMNDAHIRHPDRWHELYEFWDGQYNGIRQYEPYDKIV